jgi:microcystin-dependent protein
MPRNGSGVASIVNTFTPLTTADANQVNANFTDVATMITDSLPRDGQAGMTGQLLAISGTQTEPGMAFTADPNTGFRRPAGDSIAAVCGGTDIVTFDSTGASSSIAPTTGSNLANKTYVDARAPTGEVKMWPTNTAPTGYLECDGAAVSRTTYAALFAVIGTAWGTGDGSTTFNVPELRGEFIRGWDHGRGVDTGRAFASAQTEMIGPHTHPITDPGHLHAERGSGSPGATTTSQFSSSLSAAADQATNTASATTGITVGNNTGTENRPRNKALMFIIKT